MKWSKKKIILLSIAGILVLTVVILYLNFNNLVSVALKKSFNSSTVSEVYDLNFEKLRVNPFEGSIGVYGVSFEPKKSSKYAYINSYIKLTTESLTLENVDIMLLLKANQLLLDKISIKKPTVELDVNGSNPILFPFIESQDTTNTEEKKSLDSYLLHEFELVDASFHVINSVKKRDFTIENFSISLRELLFDQRDGEDLISLKNIDISLDRFSGNLTEGALKHLKFRDLALNFDSVDVQKNLDTLIFNFRDFRADVDSLDIQTKDSLFHLTMSMFKLAYLDQTVKLQNLSFEPTTNKALIRENYKYQNTQFSGTVGSVEVRGLNMDSLIYENKIFINDAKLDSISASIFKDKTKPQDMRIFPEYLGQSIAKIGVPILIKELDATNLTLINKEKKEDGTIAQVHITRGTAEVKNITNLAPNEELTLQAVAFLEDKVEAKLNLRFSYSRPEFSFEGTLARFNLTDLNPIIKSYSPAEITVGTAEEISFTGLASNTGANGTLKFLYSDLEVDLMLKEQAKWKSSIITFGANTALHSNNPISEDAPARVVSFKAERDMNKGFLNIVIKSLLNGMKETMIMSKDNRKEFNELKKETKKEAKKEAKKEKN